MPLPPIHRFTHEPIFVLGRDLAWDNERYSREKAAIPKSKDDVAGEDVEEDVEADDDPIVESPWATLSDHPIQRYYSGASRYDLQTVEPYFLPNLEPVKFRLRRLNPRQFRAVGHMRELKMYIEANYLCVKMGLRTVTGLPGFTGWKNREMEPPAELSDAKLDRLLEVIGDVAMQAIGKAVWNVSQTVFEDEGKA